MKTPEEMIANSNFADDVFLTRSQICERLQISSRILWEWHKADKAPPFVKIGGSVRYPEKFLGRWLEEQLVA